LADADAFEKEKMIEDVEDVNKVDQDKDEIEDKDQKVNLEV